MNKFRYAIKIDFRFKKNLKKGDVSFALLPVIGYMTRVFNSRSEYTIVLMLFFVQLELSLSYCKIN